MFEYRETVLSYPIFFLVVGLSLAYTITLVIYRGWFHPLAKIPGPRLAGLTKWYETYFEVFTHLGGQYTFHIVELHARYGPIVRIGPDEVHIHEPEFFDTIYNTSPAFDKPAAIQHRFGAPYAAFSTPEYHVHRQRRSAMSPFFAKGRVDNKSDAISKEARKMCDILTSDYAGKTRVLTLNHLFCAFVADVITKYAFDKDYRFLETENFQSQFTGMVRGYKSIAHPCAQFPWLPRLLAALPVWLMKNLVPSMNVVLKFQDEMKRLIKAARERDHADASEEKSANQQRTIFDGILESGLPAWELSDERLKDEAVSIIGAGIASVEWVSSLTSFHIINDPAVYKRLKAELKEALSDEDDYPSFRDLRNLPYLMACIEEGVRLGCGQMCRSPRTSTSEIIFKQWHLPPGTLISMDTWHMHHDESLYPDSFAFKPERWLDTADSKANSNRFMTSFGKGARICLGLNLAYAELAVSLAALFRRFEFELFETSYEKDVKIVRDMVAPDTHPSSLGIRVLVK